MEPPHSYIRESSASVVHHSDYLNRRDDHALCGMVLESPTTLGQAAGAVAICPDCQAKLAEYHLAWWRDKARAVAAELEDLRVKYQELMERSGDSDSETAPRIEPEPQGDPTVGHDEAEPVSLLDHARVELLRLCRQCREEAVPHWRLKTTMQAFSDKLSADERVRLAQEIGADGSLIRWCTTEVVNLGWQVSNSPVQGEPEEMWDAWTHDSYQTPKKTKWRLGRPRSQDAS
ncbi:hypothetical protein [Mycolicibacterium celeriflavum]|uniref:hypothetical protein n=1 Tax=Mycolicibacterium celeriflavum TaxID=1249101 RepID=UPI001F289860|nr:hypothetical protein [Mycolicibacterium celeriflavum]